MALTGIVYASNVKVELIHEKFAQKVMLDKAKILLKETIGYWSNEKFINSFNGDEIFNRTYLKFSRKIKKVTIYGIVGVSKMTLTVSEPPTLARTSSAKDFEWKTKEGGIPLKGKSELGFLTGIGADFTFQQRNNFEINLKAQYLLQKEYSSSNSIVLFDEAWINHGKTAYTEWHERIEIQKTRNKEFTSTFSVSKRVDKLTFSAGSLFILTKTSYLGKSVVNNRFVQLYAPYYYKKESQNKFEFKSKPSKNFSVFMEARWKANKKTEIFAKLIIGGRSGLSVGITL
jgi:hypothetical protein